MPVGCTALPSPIDLSRGALEEPSLQAFDQTYSKAKGVERVSRWNYSGDGSDGDSANNHQSGAKTIQPSSVVEATRYSNTKRVNLILKGKDQCEGQYRQQGWCRLGDGWLRKNQNAYFIQPSIMPEETRRLRVTLLLPSHIFASPAVTNDCLLPPRTYYLPTRIGFDGQVFPKMRVMASECGACVQSSRLHRHTRTQSTSLGTA